MKIDFNGDENCVEFRKLNAGDTFKYKNSFYGMKCKDITSNHITYNAVNLETGNVVRIQPYLDVIPIRLKAVKYYD